MYELGLIEDVQLTESGYGVMVVGSNQEAITSKTELHTNDYGRHWQN